MFNKKKCRKCGEKVDKKNRFCHNCGFKINDNFNYDDWGMLGKDDFVSEFNGFNEIRMPMGFNTLFSSLMKNLNKEFEKVERETDKKIRDNTPKKSFSRGISINISTLGNNLPEIKVMSFNPYKDGQKFVKKEKPIEKQIKEINLDNFSQEKLQKIASLPKEEPSTNIRRLSNKVIYEIDVPGVNSIKDVSVIRLENSIEIKALSKNKVYFKRIPINFPITNYGLSKGKLVLELNAEEE